MRRPSVDAQSRGQALEYASHPKALFQPSFKTREAIMAFRAIGRINRAVPHVFRGLNGEELAMVRSALEEEYRIAMMPPDPSETMGGRPRRDD
jgi:hypothetical protein